MFLACRSGTEIFDMGKRLTQEKFLEKANNEFFEQINKIKCHTQQL